MIEDDSSPTDETILEVPELTDEMLSTWEEQYLADDDATDTASVSTQMGEPGALVTCEVCGKEVRVRKDGQLAKHKCDPKAQRGNRLDSIPGRKRKPTPVRVRDVGISIVAWSIEEGSAHLLARPFHVDPRIVPTELPDADGMVGPILDVVWPSIPDSAQKFIEKLADESELITCALAWMEWARTLNGWVQDQRRYQTSLNNQGQGHHGASQSAGAVNGGAVIPFSPVTNN